MNREPLPIPDAAILVGGLGTRLRAITGGAQKVVAPVAGRPFLVRLLDQLADAGVRHVVLCTGYRGGDVASAISATHRDLRVEYSSEPTPLGTAGALRLALPLLRTTPVLAMNGDSYCATDLPAFLAFHAKTGASSSIVIREVEDISQSGKVEFLPSGEVTGFIEKGRERGKGWINAGIYLLGRELLESIPPGRPVSLEKETFPAWVGKGLRAFPTEGKFLDIGTPDSYAAAQYFFP